MMKLMLNNLVNFKDISLEEIEIEKKSYLQLSPQKLKIQSFFLMHSAKAKINQIAR